MFSKNNVMKLENQNENKIVLVFRINVKFKRFSIIIADTAVDRA